MKTADKAMQRTTNEPLPLRKRTAVKGKRRCRMHGGAHGSAAPEGLAQRELLPRLLHRESDCRAARVKGTDQ